MTEDSICPWAKSDATMIHYHNTEWGRPSHDDTYLFEMINLEGAQAGLSWKTILHKREGYRRAFYNFDIEQCAALSESDLEHILETGEVVRHPQKIKAVKSNALAAQRIQQEFGSLSDYIWQFTDHKRIISHHENMSAIPAKDELSEKISKDLKKRGFKFVGPVIVYSYLQAIGVIDDHLTTCPYHTENVK
ncbi:DNA-3-methyladenine glycosylase I [Thalassobacillus sp. CUG 92003]|uniref:DNA-3-methyladenine glycosylase I n=1 Tax=Thalassobacillus sp. CUG 92003 TaxID=2736641 RepID=UPI0015E7D030|nr:DNA-3-methyladenine glycosylase I [Thalassobacillus sp. CUG 92003]